MARPVYADGVGVPLDGPSTRAIHDGNQNVFSERRVTQWGWTWGQFLDHTFGPREETGPSATMANIPSDSTDPDWDQRLFGVRHEGAPRLATNGHCGR